MVIKRVFGSIAVTALVASILTIAGGASASADTGVGIVSSSNSTKQCLVEPGSTETKHHDATYKDVTTEIPGEDAVTVDESRWKRDIPGVEAVTHEETQYTRTEPATAEESYEQWKYSLLIPGLEEVSHLENQFSRTNPGQELKTHEEWRHKRTIPAVDEIAKWENQFSRSNPGQELKTHKEYTFYRDVEGTNEVSHQEYTYAQTYTEYKFQSRIKRPDNTVERKFIKGWNFVSGGSVKVNGQTVAGHWVQQDGWHAIPDVIINIVWGSGSVPRQYLGGSETNPKGSVNLSMYGGPNRSTVYYAKEITITGGYTEWGPWSEWSTTNPGGSNDTRNVETRQTTILYKDGAWTTDKPGAPWAQTNQKKVVTQEAVAGYREWLKTDDTTTRNEAEAGWFVTPTKSGWTVGKTRTITDQEYIAPFKEWRAADGSAVTDQAQAGWFTESAFTGWTKDGSRKTVITEPVAAYDEYRTADGSGSRNEADAAWSTQQDIAGWNVYGSSRTITDQEYIAPFKEWRAADGSAVTDQAQAGWFTESAFTGWTKDGSRQVITQEATESVTYYLVLNEDGSLSQSTNPADASFFTATPANLDSNAIEFGREKVITKEAVSEKVFFLTVDESGAFGETEDAAKAGWILLADTNGVDTAVWSRVVDSGTGEPIVRTIIDAEAIPGYTEYYVPGGNDPSQTLGDENWTEDQPVGWSLVDERERTVKEAVPPRTVTERVLVKAPWDEKITTPAKYGECGLAVTGNSPLMPIGVAAATLLLLGAAATVYGVRRNRRSDVDATA